MPRDPAHPDAPLDEDHGDPVLSPELPPDLIQRLRLHDARPLDVPPNLERSIMLQARARLAQAAPRRRTAWRFLVPAAAAAAVAGIVWFVQPEAHQAGGFPVQQVADDFNGDGRLDILDAFELARWQREGVRPPLADVDGDEQFTVADVDAVARRAVSLGGQGVAL